MKLISYCRCLMIIILALGLLLIQPAHTGQADEIQGYVLGWGDNSFGELADNTTSARSILIQASGLTNVIQIAAGESFALALKSDGTVWAWGENGNGQLGDGTITERHLPVQVSGLTGVKAIGAGNYHGLAITEDGSVWAWGQNNNGQLGDGTTNEQHTPVQITDLTDIKAVAAYYDHSLALKADGTVWAWGYNAYGQLGDNTVIDRHSPVQVSNLTDVSAIQAGEDRSLALKSDGTVWAWGDNSSGLLGDGSTTERHAPVQVSDLSDVSAIGVGNDHSIALESDGTVWAWGSNYDGQLGDNTTTPELTPVQVSNLSGITSIAAGGYHNLALTADGDIWAWGRNNEGQLGNSTTIDSPVPVLVRGVNSIQAVAAGKFFSMALIPETVLTISGNTGAYKATVSYNDGSPKTVRSDFDGKYFFTIPSGWSGTVTPSQQTYTFSPPSHQYTNVTSSLTGQDFSVTRISTNWTVANNNDGGAGSLREIIDDSVPGDTIRFDPSLSGTTIQLSSTLLINKNLTIDGSGLSSHVKIRGMMPFNGSGPVFYIPSGTVTLASLDIIDNYNQSLPPDSYPYPGGGIRNNSNLTVNGCTFKNNSASMGGAIYNSGTLTITNSVFTKNQAVASGGSLGYGGAIYNGVGHLTVADSDFTNNNVAIGFGSGIFNEGSLDVSRSTFVSNSTTFNVNDSGKFFKRGRSISGAITSQDDSNTGGNGIYNNNGSTVTITDNTFANNGDSSHLWSIYNNSGTIYVTNNTLSDNYGGIYNHGSLYLRDNISADNNIAGSSGIDCYNAGTMAASIKNLIRTNGSGSNACGTPLLTSDPLLQPLANYGGITRTMALPTTSPAIDVGDNATCAAKDQRGVPRPQGSFCDIGSFELGKYAISGNAGGTAAAGAILSYVDGTAKTATADANGNYSFTIIEGWSGRVTPSKTGHTFIPTYRDYTNVQSPQTNQNYTAPPPIPVLTSPDNAALVNTARPAFSWTEPGPASGYQLQYDDSPSFTTPVTFLSAVVTPTTFTPSADMPQGTSYWQVRACDGVGVCSAWSDYRSITIDSIAPTNPTSVSELSGMLNNTWQNTVSHPNFTWSGASDGSGSGLAGYYVYWGTDPAGVPATWTASPGYDPGVVSNPSLNYLRVQTKDVANNLSARITLFTFKYDNEAPSNPSAISSSSHTVNVWSADATVDASWSGASDGAGSGVNGYSIEWTTSASTLPDTTVDITGATVTSPVLATNSAWYLHLRTCDNTGNWSSTALHLGPFLIDTQAPTNPTVGSTSHALSTWSTDATVDLNWSGAADTGGSGINGYAVEWSKSPTTLPAATVNMTGTSMTSPVLSTANNWYFHIRTCDNVGNCAANAVHYGPFYIDIDGPTGSIVINNGDLYTKNPAVTVTLSATDLGIGVSQMQLSEGSTVYGWEAYNTSKSIVLSAGDGTKTVKVTFKDALGLVSQEYSAAILYDTAAPTSTITPLPGTSLIYDILVQWAATDPAPASGIATYDVQFRVGSTGDWTDWLVGTDQTSANFGLNPPVHLSEGTTYYFRVRATDKAGNVENYSLSDEATTWTTANYKYVYFPIFMR